LEVRSQRSLTGFLAALFVVMLAAACQPALAAPLTGSAYDTGDGDQANGTSSDWQGATAAGRVTSAPDDNVTDTCFIGGTKEDTPSAWAFNTSAGGCTPGKSNVLGSWINSEPTSTTSFVHMSFYRAATSGNTFLTFELNQTAATWVNSTSTAIPCRSNGDLLLSYEVGGSSLAITVYRWTGDGTGPAACPNGANGTFTDSGTVAAPQAQGAMNGASITNYLDTAALGSSFTGNSFGEGALDLPAVLTAMGQSPCVSFVQMHVHSRSSSSISSALIDFVSPVPVHVDSCTASGTVYGDTDLDGVKDAGENGLSGVTAYIDLDGDGVKDAAEPAAITGATGAYVISNVPAGAYSIRFVKPAAWTCTGPASCSYSRIFTSSGNSTANDFGIYAPASVSGAVFNDLDADGVKDAGEGALSGRTVYSDTNGNGSLDAGEPSTTTAGDGSYTLSGLTPGTTAIRTVVPPGSTCSAPAPCRYSVTLASGDVLTGRDFGAWAAASVSGSVYTDSNANNNRDPGESGISGRAVYSDTNGNGSLDAGEPSTTTAGDGSYTLSGLTPGATTIRTVVPGGSTCSTPSPCRYPLNLVSGDAPTGKDFGTWAAASVSGSLFNDLDADGTKDAGEGALAGRTVYSDANGNSALDAGEPSAATAGDGSYTLSGLTPGATTIRTVVPAGSTCSAPAPCRHSLTLLSGDAVTGKDFGTWGTASVSGTVYEDADASGSQNGGELGIPGRTVYADLNDDGSFDAGEPSAITAGDGSYTVSGLTPGATTIRTVVPAGSTCSAPAPCRHSVTPASGDALTSKDFGAWAAASVSGAVYEDADANGSQDAGELGLSGATVYADLDDSGTLDAGEPSTAAAADGTYTLSGLAPGPATIRAAAPAGFTCSDPSPCLHSLTLVSGDSRTGNDFGAFTTASVSGTVYDDADASGSQDAGELGISGRTVYADLDDNGSLGAGEPSTTTAADGSYTLSGFTPGATTIRTVLPSGSTCSAPSPCRHSLLLISGDTWTGNDFGTWSEAAVSGTVYDDADASGSQDAGELGISGRTVYADLDDSGSLDAGEPSTTTAGDGSYTLSGLTPGAITIRTVVPAGFNCSAPSPCSYSLNLSSGDSIGGKDFGTWATPGLGDAAGTIFEDLNADGIEDAGEPGVAGFIVFVDLDANGILDVSEPSAVSDATGNYDIANVPAGFGTIHAVMPGAWTCTTPVPCSYLHLFAASGNSTGNDFGVFTTASVSGTVYDDADASGTQDAGEFGISGRTIYADLDDSGSLDAGEPSTTTAGDGSYTLSGFTPGATTIRTIVPAGSTCSAPSPCRHSLTVASGDALTAKNFGTWSEASVSGIVYDDADASGSEDAGELGISGRTVYADLDDSGSLDAGEPSTTTAGDGSYTLSGLTPGATIVRTVVPAGSTCSDPSPCDHPLTLVSGDALTGRDFGTNAAPPPAPGSASGSLFHDLNGDGARDAGEDPLAGRTVYADLDSNGVKDAGEPEALTDANGDWSLSGLPAGSYPVREETPAGWQCSAPQDCDNTITITPGSNTSQDFANYLPVTVIGRWFLDSNGSGSQDGGEPGLSGWTVYVDLNGDGVREAGEPAATTDANGDYTIPGVRPGSYDLRVVSGDGSPCPAVNGCTHPVTLVSSPDPVRQDLASVPGPAGPPAAAPTPPPAATPTPPSLPRTCVSRRTIKLRVRVTKTFHPVSAKIWFRGKRIHVTRERRRLTADLDMNGLGRGRYAVRFEVRTNTGRIFKGYRYYFTCTKSRGGKRLAIP
jgi:hypothetical protein